MVTALQKHVCGQVKLKKTHTYKYLLKNHIFLKYTPIINVKLLPKWYNIVLTLIIIILPISLIFYNPNTKKYD